MKQTWHTGLKNKARRVLRWAWIYFLYYTGFFALARRRITSSAGIVVLTFHRVLDDPGFDLSNSPRGMAVRKSTFESLLFYLRSNCEVLPLAADSARRGEASSKLVFAVTFDDGWKDTSDIAYQLSKSHNVPIAVFICPGLVGKANPFWPERVVRAWRAAKKSTELHPRLSEIISAVGLELPHSPSFTDCELDAFLVCLKGLRAAERDLVLERLTALEGESLPSQADIDATMAWKSASEMAHGGAQIGSHTYSHQILPQLASSEAQRELAVSKEIIEKTLGRSCKLFAYPNGSWSWQVRDLVAKEGYLQAFINAPGVWDSHTDPFLIPRVNIWEGSLVGPSGRFSPVIFQYTAVWACYRAQGKRRRMASPSSPVIDEVVGA